MKLYCGECFEEIGNCLPWCGEVARAQNQTDDPIDWDDNSQEDDFDPYEDG